MPVVRLTIAKTGHGPYDAIRIERPLAWPGVKSSLWFEGVHVETIAFNDLSLQSLAATDCLILHGVPSPNLMNILRWLPCRLAMFADDLMQRDAIPKWNPHTITEAEERCLAWCFEHACAIVATTQPLAQAIKYPDKTRVQGNLLDFPDSGPVPKDPQAMNGAIYIGGNSHSGDLELLNDLEWHGRTVIWSDCLPSAKSAMFRNVRGGMELVPNHPRWGHIPCTNSIEEYDTWLRNLAPHFGIGLAPLLDCPFNRAKSILKVLEYIKCGLVPVVSAVPPYCDLCDDSPPGVEFMVQVGGNEWDTWSRAVMYAANHYPEKAEQGWEWARANHSYQAKSGDWIETYKWIAGKI